MVDQGPGLGGAQGDQGRPGDVVVETRKGHGKERERRGVSPSWFSLAGPAGPDCGGRVLRLELH